MQAKKYLSAALAVGFAAVGVSANYMPDITHVLESHSGVVLDGEAEEFTPQAVVKRVSEIESIPLPAYEGQDGVYITAEDNGFVLYSGDQKLERYSFIDDAGEVLTASVADGRLTFTNALGEEVTDFYIGYEHIVFDVNGDIHTSSGVLKVTTQAPKEQTLEELVRIINDDSDCFEAIDKYITSGTLEYENINSPAELVALANEFYAELDDYSGFIDSFADEDIKDKLTAVVSTLEEMTVAVNTNAPVYDAQGSSGLNMNKLIIFKSSLNNALEQENALNPEPDENGGGQGAVTSVSSEGSGSSSSTTTTKKSTTTTTKKTTKKATTTTAAPAATQAPAPVTTQAPVATTTAAPVVKVTTTTAPAFTVKAYNKTVYALKDSTFYEQPSTSSTVRGSCTQYYNASCTGETSNGFYRVVVNGFTLYAPMSDFSADPQSTVITTKTPEIKTGNINKYTKEMLTYINELRAEYGVEPLQGYEILDNAADIRAKELKTLWSHKRPDTTDYFTVLKSVGLSYKSVGENITYGMNKTYTVKDAFENWKNSQGHFNNMISPKFKYMAIGYYSYTDKDGNDFNYWEQLFYTP